MIDHRITQAQLVEHSAPVSQRSWVLVPFRPEFFFRFNVCVTAMINHIFMSSSAVQIYELSNIHLYCQRSLQIHTVRLVPIKGHFDKMISISRVQTHKKRTSNNLHQTREKSFSTNKCFVWCGQLSYFFGRGKPVQFFTNCFSLYSLLTICMTMVFQLLITF